MPKNKPRHASAYEATAFRAKEHGHFRTAAAFFDVAGARYLGWGRRSRNYARAEACRLLVGKE